VGPGDRSLLDVVSDLSSARDLPRVTEVVRQAARRLTGADGVTFVLKDGGDCYYADEDAIAPLWKGRRFPLASCISGWVMTHAEPAAIPDIYQDPRIPHDAYRPTFVKSLLMVPVRVEDPVAAIGAYWASEHRATADERHVLETLARAASLALTNVQLWTELQRSLEGERVARKDAEAASRLATKAGELKDQFLATVSHELRTPLNVMQGWLWQLRQPGVTPERQRQALETLDRNVTLQCRLVEDLLDVSRAIAGRLTIERRLVDLASIVCMVVDLSQTAAADGGVTLAFRAEDTAPLVRADSDRLQQIVWNLVANALKFTPRGGRIDVAVGRAGSRATLTVRDTGVGVSSAFLPYMFDQFRQEDASATRPFGGLGIGLTIVAHLVRLHGGQVVAESAGKDHGTTIRVELPIPAVLAEPGDWLRRRVGTDQANHAAALTGLTILVIDDEPDAGIAVRHVLEPLGATVHVAHSADEALALALTSPPDLVLADLAMPGTDGFGFLERFRERQGASTQIPVAALTALSAPDYETRTAAAGFETFLQKPIAPAELAAQVARLVGRGSDQIH
jgi:signal transduction histidine kinase/CheY-like chemotaxis protein